MTEKQYNFLNSFPKDKSIISYKAIYEETIRFTDSDGEYKDIIEWLWRKDFIEGDYRAGFNITDEGFIVLQKYELEKGKSDFITDLQFQKLKSDVIDLENKINSFKPTNFRANLAIAISLITLIIALLKGCK